MGEHGDDSGQLDPFTGRWVPAGNGQRPRQVRTPVVLAVVAGLVVIGGGIASFALLSNSSTTAASFGPVRTDQPGAPSATSSSARSDRDSSAATTKAVVPGWHGVDGARYGIVCDVPKDWRVASSGEVVGFEKPDPKGPSRLSR